MKSLMNHIPIRLLTLLAWAGLALALTMLPNSVPFVGRVSRTLGGTAAGAAFGHAGLFGMLALMLYLALRMQLSQAWALLLAVVFSLLLATGTEFYQVLLADRDASLVDLLANYLGIFLVGFCVSYTANLISNPQPSR